jgi:nucleotide-binding universal stress UspA family protein
MAAHRRGLQDMLVGPNTEYVVRHFTRSVLVAR